MHSWQSDSFSVQLFGNEIVFFVSLIFFGEGIEKLLSS